jgi:hypothetical protein
MRAFRYILFPLLFAGLLLSGCRSSSSIRKNKEAGQLEDSRLIHSLLAAPEADELTASLSVNVQGTRITGQLRMRRGKSIQISASVLGLMEVARIEFLPEMVVVIDRYHNLYSVCHYADIPYRNELGLDFEVVQALLWNRLFSPGSANPADAATRLLVQSADEKGILSIKDMECGYTFTTDVKGRLASVSKSVNGDMFSIGYADFSRIPGISEFPAELSVSLPDKTSVLGQLDIKLSSLSTEKKNWQDRTQVSRRMRQVTLDELLDNMNI